MSFKLKDKKQSSKQRKWHVQRPWGGLKQGKGRKRRGMLASEREAEVAVGAI